MAIPNGAPQERPQDPMTARDGANLYNLVEKYFKDISGALRDMSGRLATVEKNQLDTLETVNLIDAGASQSRVNRLQIDLKESELELAQAERAVEALREKLTLKEDIKNQSVDTNERIQSAAASAVNTLDAKRRESRSVFLADLKITFIKGVVGFLAISISGGVLAFVFFLIQLYLNRGSP